MPDVGYPDTLRSSTMQCILYYVYFVISDSAIYTIQYTIQFILYAILEDTAC